MKKKKLKKLPKINFHESGQKISKFDKVFLAKVSSIKVVTMKLMTSKKIA